MKSLIILILLVVLTSIVHAESIQKNKMLDKNRAEILTNFQSLNISFSIDAIREDRIDPKYQGHSPSQLINSIDAVYAKLTKRSEFESLVEFNARMQASFTSAIPGIAKSDDVYAFVYSVVRAGMISSKGIDPPLYRVGNTYTRTPPPPGNETPVAGISYSYDPDASNLRVFFILPKSSFNGEGSPDSFPDKSPHNKSYFSLDFKDLTTSESKGSYLGSNAYGVRKEVFRIVQRKTGLATNSFNFTPKKIESNSPVFQFEMSNNEAKAELPNLKVLIVFKPISPYMAYSAMRMEPTLTNTNDTLIYEKYLTGEIIGIVLFSGKTGRIFAKLPLDLGKSE